MIENKALFDWRQSCNTIIKGANNLICIALIFKLYCINILILEIFTVLWSIIGNRRFIISLFYTLRFCFNFESESNPISKSQFIHGAKCTSVLPMSGKHFNIHTICSLKNQEYRTLARYSYIKVDIVPIGITMSQCLKNSYDDVNRTPYKYHQIALAHGE